MEIRPYSESDEQEVAALWREAFPDASAWNLPEQDIRYKLAVQRDLFVVAIEDSKVVGTTMGGYDGHRGWIYYVAVDPAWRKRGVGSALMRDVERRLREIGCPKANLQVRPGDLETTAFYERLGYEVEERVSMGKLLKDD